MRGPPAPARNASGGLGRALDFTKFENDAAFFNRAPTSDL